MQVRSHFRPEFVNRIDEFIIFDPLSQDQIAAIVRLQARRVAERLADKKIGLQLTDAAVRHLAAIGYDPVYGARPVKRAVQRELETNIAKALLRGEFVEDDTIVVDMDEGSNSLMLKRGPKLSAAAASSNGAGPKTGAADRWRAVA